MRHILLVLTILLLFTGTFAQKAKRPAGGSRTNKAELSATALDDKTDLEKAIAIKNAAERTVALQKFLADHPRSGQKEKALESLVVARAAWADEKLANDDAEGGIELFELALREAPQPIPARLFSEAIVKFPTNLFWRGHRAAAYKMAAEIEQISLGNGRRLAELAAFFVGIENGAEALRLAKAAVEAEPGSATAYLALGVAERLNFDLENAAAAYQKALELDANSVSAKHGLAEMKRALGRSDEAVVLYRELLAKNEKDLTARSGLVMALFDAADRETAEAEFEKALDEKPDNFMLLASAGYWYAAHGDAEKAIEYGRMATQAEPRYVWGHIALARGLLAKGQPIEAETTLIRARKFGDFPTLNYEIAEVRLAMGFYREAVEELRRNFSLANGKLRANLGRRIQRQEDDFEKLLSPERQASIFQPRSADSNDAARRLKTLLELDQELSAQSPDEAAAARLAAELVAGDDKMRFFRKIYAADMLSSKKIALAKADELVRSAVADTDAALEAPAAAPAVIASELYPSRALAFSRDEFIIMPQVPRSTLSAIVRGRIEEIGGWTLYQEGKYPEAVTRLRRAVSVMPDKSAWWRASMWKLGSAYQAEGKETEALDSYIKSYVTDKPDYAKYLTIETLYEKVNGSSEGLETKIGKSPIQGIAGIGVSKPDPEPTPEATPEPTPEATPELTPQTTPEPTPQTTPEPTPEATPEPTPQTTPEPTPEATPEPTPEATAEKARDIKKTGELFAPVIISVPRSPAAKVSNKDKDAENAPDGRPRVIEGKDVTDSCTLSFSQNSVSILRSGGSVGLLVGTDGGGHDLSELKAVSNSDKDVQVTAEPDLGGKGKRFFIVRSISERSGLYQVNFSGVCGGRELVVRVR